MAKAKTVSYNPAARAELADAGRWYHERSLNAGPEFLAAVERLLETILLFPQMYALNDDARREARVEGYPYSVAYRETSLGIRVVAVAHAAREPGYWAGRE